MHELLLDFRPPSKKAKSVVIVFEFRAGISILLEYRAFFYSVKATALDVTADLDIFKRRPV
jgi:hypothetical protein